MPLRRPPQKKMSPAQQKWFWTEYDAGKIREHKKRQFDIGKERAPVFASPSLMGTVRKFATREDLLWHITRVSRLNRIGTHTKFDSFEFQPTQILAVDKKGLRTLERVYRAPNMLQLIFYPFQILPNAFVRIFLRRIKDKATVQEVKEACSQANREIMDKFYNKANKEKAYLDAHEGNFLVLDFDPETKKPLIAIVDHGKSIGT